MRYDGRQNDELRKIKIKKSFLKHADGSCLMEMGNTKVICSASIEEKVPNFLRNQGKGWLTAEYGMLPASCTQRIPRESSKGRPSGRTQEIQRLIGRSLRAVTDLTKLGERTIWLDADVLQGDGGTRTAAITGCFIALGEAVLKLLQKGLLPQNPIQDYIAAISVGMVGGKAVLDLCYEEDSKAEVDMNIVMTGRGKFVEVQGTAEGNPFTDKQMQAMTRLAKKGIAQLHACQRKIITL